MKKFIFVAILANLFYGCQSLSPTIGTIRPQGQNLELNMEVEEGKELKQESFYLSDAGIAYFLDVVSGNIRNNVTRNYTDGNAFDLYMGEYIAIPTNAYNVTLLTAPAQKSYVAYVRGGMFYFRSLYQGKYGFSLEKYGEPAQTIVINNKSPFKISSFDLNSLIVSDASEKDIGKLKNSVKAFKILFPESPKVKDVSMALFNQAVENNDKQIVNSEANFLEDNFELSSEEKIRIILGKENSLQNDYVLSSKYLNIKNNSPELNEVVKNNIIKRGKPTAEELIFLEEYYANMPTRELADALGVFYFRSGNIAKGTHYSENNKYGILPEALKNKTGMKFETVNTNNAKDNVDEEIDSQMMPFSQVDELYRSGVDYYGTESYAEAILVLEKAKKQMEPDYQDAQNIYYLLGNSYYMTENLDKAQENFEKISKSDAKYPEVSYKLGDISFKKGNRAKAEKIFKEISSNYNSTVWGRRSIIYLRRLK